MASVSSTAVYANAWPCGALAALSCSGSSAGGRWPSRSVSALAVPAAWVEFSGGYGAWWVDGLA